jgi:RimJ/RimL family protein N-acetyltransferase
MDRDYLLLDKREPVVESFCRERELEIIRYVRPTELSLERLRFIWDKLKDFKVLFNDHVAGDFQAFINHFIVQVDGEYTAAGLMWDVDDVGMFFLNEIRPAISGTAHFTFWDKRTKGREDLCRDMIRYVFDTYKFVRIETRVPLYAKSALAATERIGFIQEGRLRDSVLYEGKWFDVNVYSILPRDLDEIPEKDLSSWRHRRLTCWGCGEIYTQKLRGELDGPER